MVGGGYPDTRGGGNCHVGTPGLPQLLVVSVVLFDVTKGPDNPALDPHFL